jgi:hypothetical protein
MISCGGLVSPRHDKGLQPLLHHLRAPVRLEDLPNLRLADMRHRHPPPPARAHTWSRTRRSAEQTPLPPFPSRASGMTQRKRCASRRVRCVYVDCCMSSPTSPMTSPSSASPSRACTPLARRFPPSIFLDKNRRDICESQPKHATQMTENGALTGGCPPTTAPAPWPRLRASERASGSDDDEQHVAVMPRETAGSFCRRARRDESG